MAPAAFFPLLEDSRGLDFRVFKEALGPCRDGEKNDFAATIYVDTSLFSYPPLRN
jgi:hypothetical protein